MFDGPASLPASREYAIFGPLCLALPCNAQFLPRSSRFRVLQRFRGLPLLHRYTRCYASFLSSADGCGVCLGRRNCRLCFADELDWPIAWKLCRRSGRLLELLVEVWVQILPVLQLLRLLLHRETVLQAEEKLLLLRA